MQSQLPLRLANNADGQWFGRCRFSGYL